MFRLCFLQGLPFEAALEIPARELLAFQRLCGPIRLQAQATMPPEPVPTPGFSTPSKLMHLRTDENYTLRASASPPKRKSPGREYDSAKLRGMRETSRNARKLKKKAQLLINDTQTV